jgi:hypothetical protein
LRLGLFAREQRRSDEGLHDNDSSDRKEKLDCDGPRL